MIVYSSAWELNGTVFTLGLQADSELEAIIQQITLLMDFPFLINCEYVGVVEFEQKSTHKYVASTIDECGVFIIAGTEFDKAYPNIDGYDNFIFHPKSDKDPSTFSIYQKSERV